MRLILTLLFSLLFVGSASTQPFSATDSIQGGLTPERSWWDLTFYRLNVEVDPENQFIRGSNVMKFTALKKGQKLQIDLQAPMKLTEVMTPRGEPLAIRRKGSAHYVTLPQPLARGASGALVLYFKGKPKVAKNPPWDGGITWAEDRRGRPFVANANQGIGPSVWWPCKDHPADEVDSMAISVTVPKKLVDVSNGELRRVKKEADGRRTFKWFVHNPINSYGVNLSVGDYVGWSEVYRGEEGPLPCSYYVIRGNKRKARRQFRQVPMMLAAFEHWFGPYPFYEDGFKLVEVPYLGMEHQSAVTYGNEFANGYRGKDLSGTGEGLKFDFIIVHEAGHEWFANSITNADVADMWIHEGFTAYSENLYLDYHFGTESAARYVIGTRSKIQNDRPIRNPNRGVGRSGSGDMYYKGANMLHTLRNVVDDDEKWRTLLRGLNRDFRHRTVSSDELVAYVARSLEVNGLDVKRFFEQYTETTQIPVLQYYFSGPDFHFRWKNVVDGFVMPLELRLGTAGKYRVTAKEKWQKLRLPKPVDELEVDPDFYVYTKRVKPH